MYNMIEYIIFDMIKSSNNIFILIFYLIFININIKYYLNNYLKNFNIFINKYSTVEIIGWEIIQQGKIL